MYDGEVVHSHCRHMEMNRWRGAPHDPHEWTRKTQWWNATKRRRGVWKQYSDAPQLRLWAYWGGVGAGAPQPELWAVFATKARRTRIGRRKVISLLILRSVWQIEESNNLVTLRSGSFLSFCICTWTVIGGKREVRERCTRWEWSTGGMSPGVSGVLKITVKLTSKTRVVSSLASDEPQPWDVYMDRV